MGLFGKKKEKDEDIDEEDILDEEEEEYLEKRRKRMKLRDLNPENKRKRKEPAKPWGKKERIFVLAVFVATIIISAGLGLSSRNYKLPNLPRLAIPGFSFDFSSQPIIIGKKSEANPDKKKNEEMINSFKESTNKYSGLYAFYLVRLNSQSSFGVNENEKMQAASLMKLPVIVALYKEAELGKLDLNAKYALKASDKAAGSGSLYSRPVGTVVTLRQLALYMGHESDNTAFRAVVGYLGEEKVKEYIKDFGMTKTDFDNNITSPKDIGNLFNLLWQGKLVSLESRDEILGYLTKTIYEDYLPKLLPTDIRVAHKYGRELHCINDAGIIFSPKPFVLVLMTDGIKEKEAEGIIPVLAKNLYELENK